MNETPNPSPQFKIDLDPTNRGFLRGDFKDLYGRSCSIQQSSLATKKAIWLGVDKDTEGKPSSRMHLSQEQVNELLPHLQRFAETGSLADQQGTEE